MNTGSSCLLPKDLCCHSDSALLETCSEWSDESCSARRSILCLSGSSCTRWGGRTYTLDRHLCYPIHFILYTCVLSVHYKANYSIGFGFRVLEIWQALFVRFSIFSKELWHACLGCPGELILIRTCAFTYLYLMQLYVLFLITEVSALLCSIFYFSWDVGTS